MSDIFTVVLDLSRVNNGNKSNQLYLAMADTTKMKKIYDFKHYIQFLFSLGCSVELFHEDVRLPDLEDIRVLSHLDVVQVRPENVEEKNYEGKKLISKSKGYNEEHGDGDPRAMPGDSVANYYYTDSKENVCNFKSLEPAKIVQAQEVSGFGGHGKAEMCCGPSFPAGNTASSTVQKPKDNMVKNMFDVQDKTFRVGEKTGMAENLKLAAFLQNRYYGLCRKPNSNIVTGRSHFQKSNEMPDLKSGEKPCMLRSSGKFTDDDGGVGNKPSIPNEGDVNISKKNFQGTMLSPVKLKEVNNHELCGREPRAFQIRSKSCSRSRSDHSGPYGSHVIPGTVEKPLTSVTADYHEKNSCSEGSFVRKPLTVDEALKILTEVAAERSKTLSDNNPAFHNDGKKNQFRGVCKIFKANPTGGSQNFQKGNLKHQITSKKPATLDKYETAIVTPYGYNPKAVSCQSHVPKQDIKKCKVNKNQYVHRSGYKNQGDALLKRCEQLCENQSQKTGNTGKFEAKTGAQNKKMCKANMSTETEDKSQGKTSVKGCQKIDGNQGGETESSGKVKETGAPNPLLQCDPTEQKKKLKKKKKPKNKKASVSHPSISDCEHFDNSHGNDKVEVAENTESETVPSNHLVKNGDVKDKVAPGDDLGELSNSGSAFLEERFSSAVLNDIKGKAFNGGESAGLEKSLSRELNSSRGDSEPDDRLPCSSPDNPTGVDTSSKNTSYFRFPGKNTRLNSRRDLQTTDRVNTEDEDGANGSNSSANSFWYLYPSDGAVAQDAAYPFLDLRGKTVVSKEDNKDKSESHESPITNKVIALPNIITDNTSVQYTNDNNVSGDGGEGGLVSSQGQARLTRNDSQNAFRIEGALALTGVGTGSARIGGTGSASSGSPSVPTQGFITPPLRIVESVKTEESQDLHSPEGSGHDTKVGQLLGSLAISSGKSANVRTGNDSRSGAGKKECVIC